MLSALIQNGMSKSGDPTDVENNTTNGSSSTTDNANDVGRGVNTENNSKLENDSSNAATITTSKQDPSAVDEATTPRSINTGASTVPEPDNTRRDSVSSNVSTATTESRRRSKVSLSLIHI